MADDLKDQRVVTMMSPAELRAIDDWMFDNRIRSRGEAIRRLCQIGVAANERLIEMQEGAIKRSRHLSETMNELTTALREKPEAQDIRRALLLMHKRFVNSSASELEALAELNAIMATLALGRDVDKALERSRQLKAEIAALRKEGKGINDLDALLRSHIDQSERESAADDGDDEPGK
ncbi:MAG: hypothetical protein E5X38_16030 [Mesorhizobium sp.]|uniref:hypothetical protein n=1 Tax=Mesorhizobium sp. TaxID=1871066 RepID=UPI00120278BE|nr:hypothetical protein [Mesorhizobium sp.]TIQ86457.1 MAG: hypothetical protein E5X38_16030 [Mesorhizobium sp.]